ncbi:solute carrier organic anion transporter family member 4A1-like isoform X2 [Symsagittifera roscoffensis]|uniref:solute carrier organic anion transporter family member 4A1-like isoform X2 n=1 Tax=Symsagittifera roscoffensis TaxID=84072 RepID=UPI00307C4909
MEASGDAHPAAGSCKDASEKQETLLSRRNIGAIAQLPSVEEFSKTSNDSNKDNDLTKPSSFTSLLSKSRVEPLSAANGAMPTVENDRLPNDGHNNRGSDKLSRNERFGWLRFRPNFLQKFNSPVAMLIFICLLVAVQAKLVSGFLNTSLSTIEKVFGLSSTESGLIISTYDVASLLAVIPVTYFGQAGRKPRYLGGGAVLIAAGCFVFFLPEAFRDPYTWLTDDELQYCSSEEKNQECADHNSNHNLKFIFMVGTLLIGVGATPVYTLGVAYMDENVPKAKSALYLGIFYTIAVVAPALGYVLSGLFLRIPIDFKHWKVDIEDPGWAGAWFVGFLLQTLLALLIAIPLLGLPKRIKGKKTEKTAATQPSDEGAENIERVDETAVQDDAPKTSLGFKDIKQSLKRLPISILGFLKNVTFMLLIMHGVCAYLVISGLATFLPKYFESQFGLSSSDSAFMVGSLAIPAAAIGTLGSGVFLKYKDWPCVKVMKFGMGVQIVALPFLCFFLFSCPRYSLAGLNAPYNRSDATSESVAGGIGSSKVDFDWECNSDCSCDYVFFDPVCAENGITYFSPCHAGCYNEDLLQCKCLLSPNGDYLSASRMICEENCPTRKLSYTLFFFMLMVASMVSVPHITCLLRVVPDSQRSLALGLQWVFVRLLGTIPGPIIVGKIFDSTCLLWNESKACHESSFCLSNDSKKLGLYTFLYAICPMSVGLLFLFSAVKTYKPANDLFSLGEENQSEKQQEQNMGTSLEPSGVDNPPRLLFSVENDSPPAYDELSAEQR